MCSSGPGREREQRGMLRRCQHAVLRGSGPPARGSPGGRRGWPRPSSLCRSSMTPSRGHAGHGADVGLGDPSLLGVYAQGPEGGFVLARTHTPGVPHRCATPTASPCVYGPHEMGSHACAAAGPGRRAGPRPCPQLKCRRPHVLFRRSRRTGSRRRPSPASWMRRLPGVLPSHGSTEAPQRSMNHQHRPLEDRAVRMMEIRVVANGKNVVNRAGAGCQRSSVAASAVNSL